MATKKPMNPALKFARALEKAAAVPDDPTLKQPLQQDNVNKVPLKKWKNWPDIAQRVFNETHAYVLCNQNLFLHPKTRPVPELEWKTTAWNTAWIAADVCQQALKDIIAGRGYAKKT